MMWDLWLLQDNAPTHISSLSSGATRSGFNLLAHPPYSLDLYLFRYLKKRMQSTHFDNKKRLREKVNQSFASKFAFFTNVSNSSSMAGENAMKLMAVTLKNRYLHIHVSVPVNFINFGTCFLFFCRLLIGAPRKLCFKPYMYTKFLKKLALKAKINCRLPICNTSYSIKFHLPVAILKSLKPIANTEKLECIFWVVMMPVSNGNFILSHQLNFWRRNRSLS